MGLLRGRGTTARGFNAAYEETPAHVMVFDSFLAYLKKMKVGLSNHQPDCVYACVSPHNF
jgi:hypothetical protein